MTSHEQIDKDVCHPNLRLLVSPVGVKNLLRQRRGCLPTPKKRLEPTDEAIGHLAQMHRVNWFTASHYEADFLIGPTTLMEFRM